jgi:hypothetical protein
VVAAFALAEIRGVNVVPETHRVSVPASVRGSTGGYRAYRSWGGGGFRGGK